MDESEITCDTLLRGRVRLLQPRRGLRSSLDPVLLAAFVTPPFGHFLDIGCGTGALSFLLLARDPAASGVGAEIQPRLAELASEGARENGFLDRFRVASGDVRSPGAPGGEQFDLVATNPPFRPIGTGNLPPLSEKALANHEVSLALAEWLAIAASVLRPDGRLAVIFPFQRWEDLEVGLAAHELSPVRRRVIHSRIGVDPQRVMVEAKRGRHPMDDLPALVVHDQHGYSPEVRAMLGDEP